LSNWVIVKSRKFPRSAIYPLSDPMMEGIEKLYMQDDNASINILVRNNIYMLFCL
jgi:hypothetical protein